MLSTLQLSAIILSSTTKDMFNDKKCLNLLVRSLFQTKWRIKINLLDAKIIFTIEENMNVKTKRTCVIFYILNKQFRQSK